MTSQLFAKSIARLLIASVFATFCGLTELAQAQQAAPPNGSSPSVSEPQPAQQTTPGMVDPSAGPLAPVPSNPQELPSAPSSTPVQQEPPPSLQQPVGAAGAEIGPTAGGAASKPAGNAIAPAKQHQTRSFLIKLGAVAAAGVAIGTVVALSRGTSSNPPGAH
jgi:cell division septation protein DedD